MVCRPLNGVRFRHSFLASCLLLLPAAAVPAALTAQDTLRPARVPSCPRCVIEVRPLVRLGDDEGQGSLSSDPYWVVQDSRGRYVLALPDQPDERIAVFDASGRFLKRFGRRGDGPGELRAVAVLKILPGDTLLVYDEIIGRLSVFDAEYRFVRSSPAPRGLSSVDRLTDGSIMVSAAVYDAERAGKLYHRFHQSGNLLSSFGDSRQVLSPVVPYNHVRFIGASHGGGFWSIGWMYRYRLELWHRNGTLARVLEPDSEWFLPYDRIYQPTPTRPPASIAFGVAEDNFGRVWVLGAAAASRFARGLGAPRQVEGTTIYPIEDLATVWDGVIDVFDPSSGRLIATRRIDDPYHFFLSSSIVAGVRHDEKGRSYVQVASLHLRSPR